MILQNGKPRQLQNLILHKDVKHGNFLCTKNEISIRPFDKKLFTWFDQPSNRCLQSRKDSQFPRRRCFISPLIKREDPKDGKLEHQTRALSS